MKKLLVFILLLFSMLLVGCASTVNGFFNRGVIQDYLEVEDKPVVGTLTVTAARRIALVSLEGKNRGKFCAEPPPDVSENISTALDVALKAETVKFGGEAKLSDQLKVDAVVLSKRTALLDVYRTGTYALCQYYLNDAITGAELNVGFKELTEKVVEAMRRDDTETGKVGEEGVKPQGGSK